MVNQSRIYTGTVQQILDYKYIVVVDQRRIKATQAAGCLLVPEKGDSVLCVKGAADKTYIISVLNRNEANPACVSVPADTVIATKGGELLLQTDKKISLTTPNLQVQADRGVAEIRETIFSGSRVELSINHLSAFWQTVEQRAERVLDRISRLYRRIGNEDSQLGQVHYGVDEGYSLEAGDICIEANERLRLDGDRVEVG